MSEATAIRIANVKYAGTGLQLLVRWTNNQEMTVNLGTQQRPVSLSA
ncbi:MAG TPA: hypothetical protein VLV25_06065 [Steroidobacteraceae bacterium]|nr:hypothetical protein [Steroidobacteraceae bacterium]